MIDPKAHVRLAHRSTNRGAAMLRRAYNFADGTNSLGRLDAGLFFLAYVRRPSTQYIPMQTRLSREDVMMEHIQHTGSGLFAVPGGARKGSFVGAELFD